MCGRYTYKFTWRQIHDQLSLFGVLLSAETLAKPGPEPQYNVGPKATVPVLRDHRDGLEAAEMQWWLAPHWAKSPDSKYPTFNARSETAATKPAFREPFRSRRCVIPASGFYEWKKRDDGSKQPYYIARADGEPLYFAGLWDAWGDPGIGPQLESCTVLTTEPNAEMRGLHDRMPCILEPEQVSGWVGGGESDLDKLAALLKPASDGVLVMHPVSRRVNSSRTPSEPGLIEPSPMEAGGDEPDGSEPTLWGQG